MKIKNKHLWRICDADDCWNASSQACEKGLLAILNSGVSFSCHALEQNEYNYSSYTFIKTVICLIPEQVSIFEWICKWFKCQKLLVGTYWSNTEKGTRVEKVLLDCYAAQPRALKTGNKHISIKYSSDFKGRKHLYHILYGWPHLVLCGQLMAAEIIKPKTGIW